MLDYDLNIYHVYINIIQRCNKNITSHTMYIYTYDIYVYNMYDIVIIYPYYIIVIYHI